MTNRKIDILFFTSSLSCGGAERVLVSVLKNIDRSRFTPYLALLRDEGELLHEVPSDVAVHSVEMSGYKIGRELIYVIRRLRKIIRETKPDLIFSFMWEPNLLNVLASLGTRRKTVISERVAISKNLKDLFGRGLKLRLARKAISILYRRSSRIIAVSHGIKRELILLGIPEDRIVVIHNPVDIQQIESMSLEKIDAVRPYIIYVGRLEQQKNVPSLIRAFYLLKDRLCIDLMILGKGEKGEELSELCRDLKISDRVHFLGFEKNPYKYIRNAEVFVLPSDFEGFPNVILEAMVCGVPVVSTNCPYGPGEIITDGENGLLVPVGDVHALASAIEMVFNDRSLRDRFCTMGKRKTDIYYVRNVVKKYEDVIFSVMGDNILRHNKTRTGSFI